MAFTLKPIVRDSLVYRAREASFPSFLSSGLWEMIKGDIKYKIAGQTSSTQCGMYITSRAYASDGNLDHP
jgi:predicted secreted protein